MSFAAYMKRVCIDTAVYWAVSEFNSEGGIDYATPIEISCTWLDESRTLLSNEGRQLVSQAVIYVVKDLDQHGLLYHGELSDLTSSQKSDPLGIRNVFEIIKFEKKPSRVVSNEYGRVAYV